MSQQHQLPAFVAQQQASTCAASVRRQAPLGIWRQQVRAALASTTPTVVQFCDEPLGGLSLINDGIHGRKSTVSSHLGRL